MSRFYIKNSVHIRNTCLPLKVLFFKFFLQIHLICIAVMMYQGKVTLSYMG